MQVAVYCRVSTDQGNQANSFQSQQRFFREYIARQDGWRLYAVYADEGISGTSTQKRAAFHRMIADAREGKFSLLLTKEVSRFSRNILDTIAYTRELKALGVGVFFVNDGIRTMDSDAELRLSIMASLAQEESRKTSDRVKWGQLRRMEQGVVFGRSMLGYDVREGRMSVNPDGAAVVRLIFHKYVKEQKGISVIARELTEEGYRTYGGNREWSGSGIAKILKNEKYVGDLIQKKTYTPNYLTHAKKTNHGEEEQVILRNHHEPIIDRALWEAAQRELKRRNRHGECEIGHGNCYLFSGKIRCGECGGSFVARIKRRKNGTVYRKWGCLAAMHGRCDVGRMLRDDAATELLRETLDKLNGASCRAVRGVTAIVANVQESEEKDGKEKTLQSRMASWEEKRKRAIDSYLARILTAEEMRSVTGECDRELESLRKRLLRMREERESRRFSDTMEKEVKAILSEGNAVFYRHLLDHMTVFQDGRVEVSLKHLPQRWVFVRRT